MTTANAHTFETRESVPPEALVSIPDAAKALRISEGRLRHVISKLGLRRYRLVQGNLRRTYLLREEVEELQRPVPESLWKGRAGRPPIIPVHADGSKIVSDP